MDSEEIKCKQIFYHKCMCTFLDTLKFWGLTIEFSVSVVSSQLLSSFVQLNINSQTCVKINQVLKSKWGEK